MSLRRADLARLVLAAVAVLVTLTLIATRDDLVDVKVYDVRLDGYSRTDDPRRIVVYGGTGYLDEVVVTEAREDAQTVTIVVRARDVRAWGTFKQLSATLVSFTFFLREPLGDRSVLDSAGRVLPELSRT